ncbi:MAG: creatininase family protein [Planctomycetota bacterium]|nr:MAG: creatininase family protein [Planctomycetota bacterium]
MQLTEMNWPAIDRLCRETPVVFPVAALEQHGHHLPVFTDSMLLGEVVRRVDARIGERVLFAPLQWLGNSDHHLDFPGTLSSSPRVYLDLLKGLADNFIRHGFRRLVFINGHGGNDIPGRQAVFELRQQYRDRDDLLLLFATYWDFGTPRTCREDLVQREMGHACEWETSMILRIAPHLVQPHTAIEEVPFGFGFGKAYRGWTMKDRSMPGHVGNPAHASAEKGESLFETFAQGVTGFLGEITDWDRRAWNAK